MQNILAISMMVIFIFGCQQNDLTSEKIKKIEILKNEIIKTEKDILTIENESIKSGTGLISDLKHARVEVDKLSISIMRQHIAALESGAAITISAPSVETDSSAIITLETEIRDASIKLDKTRAESSSYSSGAIKDIIDARAALEELTLASMRQKLLSAQYGLFLPQLANFHKENKELPASQMTPLFNTEDDSKKKSKQLDVDDSGPYDFRSIRWGMTPKEVKDRESSKIDYNDPDALTYFDNVLGKKVTVFYFFDNNKLWRAGYALNEKYTNMNMYADAYFEFVALLKEKYGKPKKQETTWSNDLYKNRISERGMAYAASHVATLTIWDHGDTEIAAYIRGNDFKITVTIIYSDKNLESAYRKKENEKNKSQL